MKHCLRNFDRIQKHREWMKTLFIKKSPIFWLTFQRREANRQGTIEQRLDQLQHEFQIAMTESAMSFTLPSDEQSCSRKVGRGSSTICTCHGGLATYMTLRQMEGARLGFPGHHVLCFHSLSGSLPTSFSSRSDSVPTGQHTRKKRLSAMTL